MAVIIVAGGSGTRMGSDIPKQFLLLGNKPVLMHTIEVFKQYDTQMKIILVLPKYQIDYWTKLCIKYNFNVDIEIACGGETRFQSVKNGLALAKEFDVIGIHDGVRPLVSVSTIARCFEKAALDYTAVPVIDPIDSLRQLEGDESKALTRAKIKMVQTPQVFQASIIFKAYNQSYNNFFTDDASVVESIGYKINLVKGNVENIKITSPIDLKIAEFYICNT